MHIMVIDDEPSTCHLVKTILRSMGHAVSLSYDGEDALKKLNGEQDNLPGLIILDIMLPKMSGYDVARVIKANDRLKRIPVVFFSAKDKRELEQKAKEFGAAGIILKPFGIDDFQKKIIETIQ